MKRKLFALLLLAAVAACLLPATAFAASYDVWVGGNQVTDENKNDICLNGTASYEPSSKTLTLKGYDGAQIKSNQDLIITLANGTENMVTFPGPSSAAILVNNTSGSTPSFDLTINGTGNLTVENTQGQGIMVSNGGLSIGGSGNITVEASHASEPAVLGKTVYISNTGNISITSKYSAGLASNGGMTITGNGALDINAADAALQANGNVIVQGDSRTVTAKTSGNYAVKLLASSKSLQPQGTGMVSLSAATSAVYNTVDYNSPVSRMHEDIIEVGDPAGKSVTYRLPRVNTTFCTATVGEEVVSYVMPGTPVTVTADELWEGNEFKEWLVTSSPVPALSDWSSTTTSFTMPKADVSIMQAIRITGVVDKKMDVITYDVGNDGYYPGEAELADGSRLPLGLDCEVDDDGYVHITGTPEQEDECETRFYTEEYTGSSKIQSGFTRWFTIVPVGKTTGVSAKRATSTSIKLSWEQVDGADGYEIMRAESPDGEYKSAGLAGPGDVTTVTDNNFGDGLTTGKTYYYKVHAFRYFNGEQTFGEYSDVVFATPSLAKVSGVKAVSAGTTSVKLTWSKVANAAGYKIYRSESETGTYSCVKTITPGSTLAYTNTGLTTGKTYYYKVRAYASLDEGKTYGSYSSIVSAKPVPAKVTGVKAASASLTSVRLSWSKVTGASGYKIYRATSKTGTYSCVKTITSGSTLTFTNTGRTTGKTYYYKVRAYTKVGDGKVYGSYSSIVSAKPVPAKVTGLKAVAASSTSVKLTWSKVSGASGYQVYRATSKTGTYSRVKTITSGTLPYYTNKSLTTGKTYYYKVRAYKTVNGSKVVGPFSAVVAGKAK